MPYGARPQSHRQKGVTMPCRSARVAELVAFQLKHHPSTAVTTKAGINCRRSSRMKSPNEVSRKWRGMNKLDLIASGMTAKASPASTTSIAPSGAASLKKEDGPVAATASPLASPSTVCPNPSESLTKIEILANQLVYQDLHNTAHGERLLFEEMDKARLNIWLTWRKPTRTSHKGTR
jgi:hypothetical protein